MSGRINVNPDQMDDLASMLGDRESECRNTADLLEWKYEYLRAIYPDIDCVYSGSLYHSLSQKMNHYRSLLDEAQAVVKKTEAKFRAADQSLGDEFGELGLEVLGIYDVVRIFAEYDPVTGKKIGGWDRLKAAGWTIVNFTPLKLVGAPAKVIIKGSQIVKFGKRALESLSSVRNVLHSRVLGNIFRGTYDAIRNAPASLSRHVKNAVSAVKNFSLPLGPRVAVAGGGSYRSSVKVKDLFQRFSSSGSSTAAGTGTKRMDITKKTPAERAAEKGYTGIKTSKNGGPDFADSPYMYPVKDGQKNIVQIEMKGSRDADFKAANEKAGFPDAGRKSPDKKYTWHHLDDFDPEKGTCTMQLVERKAHEATLPHQGSCSQYDNHHGEKVYNPPKKPKKIGG